MSCSGATLAGSYTTEAASVARLTSARETPSSLVSTFSTRRTHDAQVMPPMSRVHETDDAVAGVGGAWVVLDMPANIPPRGT